jgi:hypothetical protein
MIVALACTTFNSDYNEGEEKGVWTNGSKRKEMKMKMV